ncbi:MAG: hypothetical protein QOI86_5275, partial [Actinomycetota bacterium]|nr:hypothetical protein [Actinomycetota bacterium]
TIVTNTAPPEPTAVSPADGAIVTTLTPSLAVTPVTDPEGDPVYYWTTVSDGSGDTGRVWNSGWQLTASTITVPAGVLENGHTYNWHTFATDFITNSPWTWVRRFTVDQQLGIGHEDSGGPASINLANGNLTLSVSGQALPTVGARTGVALTYNSQAAAQAGLFGQYFTDSDLQRDFDEVAYLTRNDPQVSFNWGTGSVAPGMPPDSIMARWTGYVTVPSAGSYKFGAVHDDGVRISVGGTLVVDRWCDCTSPTSGVAEYGTAKTFSAGTLTQPITVEWYDATGPASMSLMYWGGSSDVPVPPSWLSRDLTAVPAGWTLDEGFSSQARFQRAELGTASVVLRGADGEAVEFPANATTATSGAYSTPADELGHLEREGVLTPDPADDRIRYTDGDGRVYRFERSGEIATITDPPSLTDPGAATYTYDGSGRLLTVTDPVSGRTMSLVYAGIAGSGSCPTPPSGFDPASALTGLLCAANYWDGSQVQLFYVSGQLARFVSPGDGTVGHDTWNFSYTAGKVSKIRDPLASDAVAAGLRADNDTTRWLYTYDASNRVATVTAPEPLASAPRPSETFSYGSGSATVDRLGTTANPDRSVTFDARVRIIADTDASGHTQTTTWDANDRPIGSTDGVGRRSTSIYDSSGNLVEQWGPAPAAWFNVAGVPVGHEAQTPHQLTGYDEGLAGLAATWWNNPNQTGTPSGRTTGLTEVPGGEVNYSWGTGVPSGSGVTSPNGFSGRLTGRITFPSAGPYYLGLTRNGPVRVLIDGVEVLSDWAEVDTDIWSNAITTTPGESKKIEIEVADTGTVSPADQFRLGLGWYHASTAVQTVPGAQLRPGYGLETHQVNPDGLRVDRVYASP